MGPDGIARYDTDWSATGPLIEKYGITLIKTGYSGRDETTWYAYYGVYYGHDGEIVGDVEVEGPTPLIAVCNLLLALKEAGKL